MASVEATLRALIGMKGMSSDAFKTLISRDESYSDGASSSLSFCGGAGQLSPLQRDILAATSSQFGRACAMLSASRWAAVNDALLILSHSNSNNMVRDRSGGEGSPLQGVCGQQFFTVARLELDVCPMEALPDIFSACGIALRTWFSPSIGTSVDDATTRDRSDDKENLSDTMRVDVVSDLLDAAWTVTVGGSNCNDVSAINAFIRMAFSDPVLTGLPHDHTAKYYAELADMGAFRRPHIMQSLVYQLCSVWRANPALCLPFAEEIKRLLVYREPQQDDHNTPDDLDIVLALEGLRGTEASGLCRFAVLIFLEGLCCSVAIDGIAADDRMKSFLDQVVLDMMELNRTKDFVAAAMIGSDAFGRKLRCWQALCVLSSHISEGLLAQLLDTYFLSLVHSCAHGIRVPMEIFGAAVGIRYPDVFLPRLLRELRQFNHSQQTLCSLFVVLGHMFLHVSSSEKYPCSPDIAAPAASTSSSSAQPLLAVHLPSPSSSTYSRSWDIATLRSVVGHLVPWLACAAGLPRNVAQLLIHTLVPCILEADMNAQKTQLGTKDEASSNAGGGSTSLDYLRAIHSYLSENRDSVRSIQKQRSFFQLYSPVRCCTVEGLTSHTMDAAGEILPVHILTVLVDALKELASEPRACWSEGERRGPEAPKGNTAVGAATRAVSDADAGGDDPATATGPIAFQRKHIPFDELQLSLASESLSRSRNAAGRKRQEVVVCATLVEKTTNLAGIARTCEIFAAQQLVLANLSVTRSDAFLGIAVSCEGWLPMAEVPEHKLGLYLRTMKSRGYVILGLEQTDKSENLATAAALPSRCVLLLGKEKEGIPVELLQEVDVFLEIPQFGVTRSLNVHVSAALALWEVTKKNTAFINDSGQDFGEEQV
jgi:tRNA(Leu) C34 or U34 (ribose-2'-O)-methylase TrmL